MVVPTTFYPSFPVISIIWMELFPAELGNWFSYIILFEDGNKLDLTLIPINEIEEYFAKSDGLGDL